MFNLVCSEFLPVSIAAHVTVSLWQCYRNQRHAKTRSSSVSVQKLHKTHSSASCSLGFHRAEEAWRTCCEDVDCAVALSDHHAVKCVAVVKEPRV